MNRLGIRRSGNKGGDKAMSQRKKRINDKSRGRATVEVKDCVDVIDEITGELCFLREIVQLLSVSSFHHEALGNISFVYIAGDMLERLKAIKSLSEQLFDLCKKGD